METRKATDMSDEDFYPIQKEQEGIRDLALGFKHINQKPHNYYASKRGVGVSKRMRTIKVSKKKPKLWDKYLKGEITLAELKEKMKI